MQIYEVVFSPTGGTAHVAQIIAAGLGNTAQTVDLTERDEAAGQEFPPDGLAVIAVPSYGGRVPTLAAERLSRLQGRGCAAVLVCVYGNRAYEDTLSELQRLAEQAGFRPVAAVAAVAEHSIVRQYGSGRPDQADEAELQEFARQIRAQLDKTGSASLQLPGSVPGSAASGAAMIPKAGKGCTGCGECARKCPASAIDPSRVRSADRHRCITCMRCVKVCPQRVRRLSPVMVKAAGWMLRKACRERKSNELFLPPR